MKLISSLCYNTVHKMSTNRNIAQRSQILYLTTFDKSKSSSKTIIHFSIRWYTFLTPWKNIKSYCESKKKSNEFAMNIWESLTYHYRIIGVITSTVWMKLNSKPMAHLWLINSWRKTTGYLKVLEISSESNPRPSSSSFNSYDIS